MRMILGIFPPDADTIAWNGNPITLDVRRCFGYLPEERGLYGKMRVRDQIMYFARLHGLERGTARTRAREWMEFLGVEQFADRLCGELSKGNQQKVQLVAAIVHAPELLVLDEPFAGLDPVNAEIILEAIRLLAERGTTLVLSSHQMFQIENACHKFCIIGGGTVCAEGTLAELRGAFPTRHVHIEPDTPAVREVLARFGAAGPSRNGAGPVYELAAATDFGALLREVVAAERIETFDKREPTLGEVYMRSLEGSPQ